VHDDASRGLREKARLSCFDFTSGLHVFVVVYSSIVYYGTAALQPSAGLRWVDAIEIGPRVEILSFFIFWVAQSWRRCHGGAAQHCSVQPHQ